MGYLTEDIVAVDWTGVGSMVTKAEVKNVFSLLGKEPQVREGAWDRYVTKETADTPRNLIVVTDLATCASRFRNVQPQRWLAAVRSASPYIVALVRNKQDEKHATRVDDILQASENRMIVCSIRKSARRSLQMCLSRALAGIDPNSVIDVRFSTDSNSLWLEFGDGKKAVLDWSQLGLDRVRPALVPASATISEDLGAIQVLREDGSPFDIDSTAIRSLIDKELATRIEKTATDSALDVGRRIRHKRKDMDLTQVELAERSGLDQALISKLEKGRHQPRYGTLAKYAKGLRLSITELLVWP